MNKYEKLFKSIYDQTKNKTLQWKQLKKSDHNDLIFNPNMVFRQFSASFEKEEEFFEVVVVEKKCDDPEHDFIYEKYAPEVLVIDSENELLVTLTDSIIDREEMMALVDLIESRNDRINKLFD